MCIRDSSEHVRLLMQHAHDNPGDHKSTESYQATFEGEGTRKTEFIVDDLKRLERDRHLELSSAVAVSVGGADGSDLDSVLIGTPIREGFLIEYSDEGAEAARKRAEKLRTHGKTLSVMQGDATMRKKDLIPKLRELKQQGYTTLVLIFLGVLHELPKRSTQQYDLKSYVGTLCDCLLYTSPSPRDS